VKAHFEGMRTGEPAVVDDSGRRIAVVLRLVPETPQEVSELRRFCRLTGAFQFVIDDGYRPNSAHIAPVYGERRFRIRVEEADEIDEDRNGGGAPRGATRPSGENS